MKQIELARLFLEETSFDRLAARQLLRDLRAHVEAGIRRIE